MDDRIEGWCDAAWNSQSFRVLWRRNPLVCTEGSRKRFCGAAGTVGRLETRARGRAATRRSGNQRGAEWEHGSARLGIFLLCLCPEVQAAAAEPAAEVPSCACSTEPPPCAGEDEAARAHDQPRSRSVAFGLLTVYWMNGDDTMIDNQIY